MKRLRFVLWAGLPAFMIYLAIYSVHRRSFFDVIYFLALAAVMIYGLAKGRSENSK